MRAGFFVSGRGGASAKPDPWGIIIPLSPLCFPVRLKIWTKNEVINE
jgi:hypothetical protein